MDPQSLQTKIDGLMNLTIQNGCTHEEARAPRELYSANSRPHST